MFSVLAAKKLAVACFFALHMRCLCYYTHINSNKQCVKAEIYARCCTNKTKKHTQKTRYC